MRTEAIILAAGMGKRMQAGQNKLFLMLQGKTVLEHTVAVFQKHKDIDGIVIVARAEELEQVQLLLPKQRYTKILCYTAGGKERQDSVACGLQALSKDCERVLIHDGARPFVTNQLIDALLEQVRPDCGTVAGVPAKDTIKRVDQNGIVQETLVRSELWNVQTPQCFYTNPIRRCHQQAKQEGYYGTDDASLLERYGIPVKIIPAYYENMKLTTPEDMAVAEVFLKRLQEKSGGQ